jgi:hypothetical protein
VRRATKKRQELNVEKQVRIFGIKRENGPVKISVCQSGDTPGPGEGESTGTAEKEL